MNILAAHLNTSRATEMYLTIVELLGIGGQNIVYHINLSSLVLLRSRETFCIVYYGIVQYTGILLQWWSYFVPVQGGIPQGASLYRENSTAYCTQKQLEGGERKYINSYKTFYLYRNESKILYTSDNLGLSTNTIWSSCLCISHSLVG